MQPILGRTEVFSSREGVGIELPFTQTGAGNSGLVAFAVTLVTAGLLALEGSVRPSAVHLSTTTYVATLERSIRLSDVGAGYTRKTKHSRPSLADPLPTEFIHFRFEGVWITLESGRDGFPSFFFVSRIVVTVETSAILTVQSVGKAVAVSSTNEKNSRTMPISLYAQFQTHGLCTIAWFTLILDG